MITLTHPTGNQNVRQALAALHEHALLDKFFTTVYWDNNWPVNRWLPHSVRSELSRRCYPQVPRTRVHLTPAKEAIRLFATKFGIKSLFEREGAPFSTTRVYQSLDAATARAIKKQPSRAVYAYEGGALLTFREARQQGTTCIYELPTGHWYQDADLFKEEAELQPAYASAFVNLERIPGILNARDEELALADYVIVPSNYVRSTLQHLSLTKDKIHVVPYGAPYETGHPVRTPNRNGKLRVIYVGALTQRKGIGYAIEAVRILGSLVEFTMIGRKVGTSRAIDTAVMEHTWIPSVPHSVVLDKISQCDVLVLPSLSEGYGLVILEALSCGVPVITTRNTGGPEVIRDGREGFFVPIRSSEAIAEKLETLARDRELLDAMSQAALQRARECTWEKYRESLTSTISRILQPMRDVSRD